MLRELAKCLGNPFVCGQGHSCVANSRPTEIFSDCIHGAVHPPSGGFDDGSGTGSLHFEQRVGGIERQLSCKECSGCKLETETARSVISRSSFVVDDG